jgi:hypothetical protein
MGAELIPAVPSSRDNGTLFLEVGRDTEDERRRKGLVCEKRESARGDPAISPSVMLPGNFLPSRAQKLPDAGCGFIHD